MSTEELKKISKPHNIRIKELLGNEDIFYRLLQGWVKNIDREMLRRNNTQYILPDFGEKVTDLVYEGNIKGQKAMFYVLLEPI